MPVYSHVLHGVRIASDVLLPDVALGDPALDPQVSIRMSAVPSQLHDATRRTHSSETDGKRWLFTAPGIARYLVTAGKEIAIETQQAANPEAVMAFLLGTAWAACCHQRGLLIVHASVALIGGKSVAFVGASGAGKSTLAALLAARGHCIAADDTCVLTLDDTGIVRGHPGYPQLKLWSDGLSLLPAAAARARSAIQPGKFRLPLESHWVDASLRLHHVLELADDRDGAAIGFEQLCGLHATRVIADNTFRPRLVDMLGRQRENFAMSTAVADAIDVHRWIRPWGWSRHGEMLAMLEKWLG